MAGARRMTCVGPTTAQQPVTRKPLKRLDVHEDGSTAEKQDIPWDEYRFLVVYVFCRPEWTKPLYRHRMQGAILRKVDGRAAGAEVELTHDEWSALRDSLEADDFELPSGWGYQLVAYADAFIGAQEVH